MSNKSLYDLIKQIEGKFYFSYDELPPVPPQPVFFYHVPKTGGISLFYALRGSALSVAQAVPQLPVPKIVKWDDVDELQQFDNLNVAKDTMLISHLSYGAHKQLGDANFSLVTVLREPVSRIVSHYCYLCMRSDTLPSIAGLEKFYRDPANINCMVKQLSPDSSMDFSSELSGQLVFDHLQENFAIYADIKYINAIITYYLSGYKLSNAIMCPMNATKDAFKIDASELEDEIRELNRADILLHQLVDKHPRLPKSKPKNTNMISPLTTILMEAKNNSGSIGGAITRGTIETYQTLAKLDEKQNGKMFTPEEIAASF